MIPFSPYRQWGANLSDLDDFRAWEIARLDMLRCDHWDMPDPEKVAEYLPLDIVDALILAVQRIDGICIDPKFAEEAFARGLIGSGTLGLSAFGLRVRRAAIEQGRTI